MKRTIDDLLRQLEAYDVLDLASGVGGLQLVPTNVERQLRFDLLASLVANLGSRPSRPQLSFSRWRQLLHEPPIADDPVLKGEDPAEGLFTDSVTFWDGSAVVFPGIVPESVEVVRRLLEAVFIYPGMPDEYVKEMQLLTLAVLRISNAVAVKAGLERGLAPTASLQKSVEIPPRARFADLKRAVTFSKDELISIIHPAPLGSLNPLLLNAGQASTPVEVDFLYSAPLLRVGSHFVAVLPPGLLVALRHRFIVRAFELSVVPLLSERFRQAVATEVEDGLGWMQFTKLGLPLGGDPAWAHEGVWSFDVDKIAHVLTLTDDFSGYDTKNPFDTWQPAFSGAIEERLANVRQAIKSDLANIDGILSIMCFQGIGRTVALGFKETNASPGEYLATISQADLSIISREEAGDPLALWKFARAGSRLRDKAKVLAFSTLDEYALYSIHGKSFYLTDDKVPNLVIIDPGTAAKMRQEDARRFDRHGAFSWQPFRVIDVQRIYPGSSIPIYAPDPKRAGGLQFLIEETPIPIWVVPASSESDRSIQVEFCEAVAYWVWQAAPSMRTPLSNLAERFAHIVIEVSIEEQSHPGIEGEHESAMASWVEFVNAEPNRVNLRLRHGASVALAGPDNLGDRQILAKVVEAIVALAAEASGAKTELDIQKLVERHAPLGPKKKLITLVDLSNIELVPGSLPSVRLLQNADLGFLLDEVGPETSATLKLQEGPVQNDLTVKIINKFVEICFARLESAISKLTSDHLLEKLMAQHESVLKEAATLRLTYPTRLACFGSEPAYIEKIKERMIELTQASVAIRFLVEYVAARPPAGRRQLSLDTFDQIMAFAAEIIYKGMLSDAAKYMLADISLSFLGSGRLGVNRSTRYFEGVEEFSQIKAGQDLEAARHWFERHWPEP